MSTTMYCQPSFLRTEAMASAFAFTSLSLIVVPYASQLFHPMGGTGASWAVCAFIGEAATQAPKERDANSKRLDRTGVKPELIFPSRQIVELLGALHA